ncbi:signal recognition particle-docking protein FtsY [Dolosigranulum pigrum]|uniref:Signal recognition particle receptor FtsY n=1 Tax=Dolosigranulum pigrum TaxID=29394 RepID=A0A516GIP1_9LACT|nr:signal recognition particle-docking protein FtsY [Dolosigranulum pigrum]QDO91356.1 signal recognition particle-docking protein FtsY [Dolosigranulum pigrum]QTJ58413.1 signal recognition particle-docking protein FtsY [Dolosigranulum pigrum]VTU61404.1 signal recognition particle-docking protein FtsY [Lactobacillus buchneri NRRL B-30929] [Dolosigranulum pigrum]
MGLFDKIKSIFTSEEQEKKSEEQDTPTEVSESDDATDDSDLETIETIDQEKVEEPLSKEEVKSLEDEMAVTSDETVKQVDKPEVEDLHSSEESNTAETSDEPQRKTQTFSEVEASARAEAEQYKEGLKKSRRSFTRRLNELFSNFRYEDEEFFEELEDLLIESDVGFEATMYISEVMRYEAKVENIRSMKDAERVLVRTMVDLYGDTNPDYVEFNENSTGLTVLLFVGVNGVGKTTTIAKMAHQYIKAGKKVMLAAGDTFRAGAIEQLHVWGERVGAEVISSQQGGDPAAVVYDGLEQAKKNGADVLMIDTAGRLQNKKNLMNELEKMKRVVSREVPDAPHETLLVLDATTGQNALNQAKIFKDTTDVTGIVLTKMDGTAKGGIVLAIGKELGIPVKFVGLGETMEDLHKFDTEKFAYGLFRDLLEQTV